MISHRLTLAVSSVFLAVTALSLLTASDGRVKPGNDIEALKQFDEMKAASNKLADDNKKLTYRLKNLQGEHQSLKTRFDETSKTTDLQVKALEAVKASDWLTKVENDLTSLNTTLNDRTSNLREGGSAIDMGISVVHFQGDGNVCIVGKKSKKCHWASGTYNKD